MQFYQYDFSEHNGEDPDEQCVFGYGWLVNSQPPGWDGPVQVFVSRAPE